MHSSQPSTVLPALAPTSPPPAALALSIDHLNALLFPAQPIIDLRVPLAPIHSEDHDSTMLDQDEAGQDDEVGMDAFEVDFARDWLNRVVAIGTRRCARGEDEMTGAWEGVIDRAVKLLTDLSGPGAQGASTRTYILPRPHPQTKPELPALAPPPAASSFYPTPPPTRPPSVMAARDDAPPPPPLELTLRDGTQLEASTGHRTWGAATLFARLLATRPGDFFPRSSSSSNDKLDSAPLRILEVGSGTGLVGMTAAKVLEALGRRGEATLSDGGDEPDAVLANLRYNVATNFPPPSAPTSMRVDVGVRALDWRDCVVRVAPNGGRLSSSREETTIDRTTRYHIIFGSDLAYERGQATLLHAAVVAHLEFPTRDQSDVPTFHLMLPLRPTHRTEMEEVESLFPPAQSSPAHPTARCSSDGEQDSFRLVTLSRERFVAPSGFDAAGSRGRGPRRAQQSNVDVTTYELRRIVWEAVSPAAA